MKMIKAVSTAMLILSSFFTNAQTIFTHIATTSNIEKALTKIDNQAINGNENKLLFVTQVFSDYYNNHPFSVSYRDGKWGIQQENKVAIDKGSIYNILAVDASENAFSHKVTEKNSSNNWTIINHPNCNNNPNAILFVTQNWKGTYNPKPIGIRYELGKWQIFNQDRSPMPIGVNFNVLVMTKEMAESTNGKAFVFTATDAKTNKFFTHLSNLPYKGNDAIIFAMQNSGEKKSSNSHEIAVWNSGPVWTIYNKDRTNLPTNTQFNIFVIGGTALSNLYETNEVAVEEIKLKPVSNTAGLIRFINKSDYVAGGVITYIYNGKLEKITTGRLAAKASTTIEIPKGVSDIKLTLQLNDILWVEIKTIDFGINAPNECYQFLGTMREATFDNNCEIKP